MAQTYKKADLVTRIIALLIDGILAGVGFGIVFAIFFWLYLGFLAPAVAAAFILIRDALLDGQSPGKKLLGIRAVNFETGQPVTQEESIRRNIPVAAGYIALIFTYLPIPILSTLLGILASLAALGIVLYDIYVVLTDEEQRRWGDQLAGTIVIPEEAFQEAKGEKQPEEATP